MECVVKSWIYGTISPELSDTVPRSRSIAHSIRLAMESKFLGNLEACSLHLDSEFRTFAQGDLSQNDYCRRLKDMADALKDLGKHVPNRIIVLTLIHNFNEKFASIGLPLQCGCPIPHVSRSS